MDEVDLAQTEIEHRLYGCLAVAKARGSIEATGQCLNCGERLPDASRRWCDAGCRDDWSRLAAVASGPAGFSGSVDRPS